MSTKSHPTNAPLAERKLQSGTTSDLNETPALDAGRKTEGGSSEIAPSGAGSFVTGTVKAFVTETEATVETANGERLHARQATSCLLAPVIGDKVLMFCEGDSAFMVSVLLRSADVTAEISVPDADKINLKARKRLEISAPAVGIAAHQLSFLVRSIHQAGETLTSNFKRIVETVIDKSVSARSIVTKAETRSTHVDQADILNTGTLVHNIDTVATHNSEITLVTAKRDVRLDGERVSVG